MAWKEDWVFQTIQLPPRLHNMLKDKAERLGVSRAIFIRQLVMKEFGLSELPLEPLESATYVAAPQVQTPAINFTA
jgi:hypothetical protein